MPESFCSLQFSLINVRFILIILFSLLRGSGYRYSLARSMGAFFDCSMYAIYLCL